MSTPRAHADKHGVLAVLSWLVLVAVAATVHPFVYSDEALQLKALQQYAAGQSPSWNRVVTADPADLTHRTSEWITWWPPATQLVTLPLVRMGVPIGTAVQIVACAALLAGVMGWLQWWRRFDLPPRLLVVVALLLPWIRYASNALFQYSAEILAFAVTPWALLLVLDAIDGTRGADPSGPRRVGVGVFAGALYWVKYSSLFITASVLLFAAVAFLRRRQYAALAAIVAGAAVPVLALSAVNRAYGGAANMLTAWHVLRLSPSTMVYAIGNPALMAADADSLLQYVLTNPQHGLLRDRLVVAALGIPGGLTLAWAALRAERPAERLAAVTLAVTTLLMVVAWVASSAVSFEARHVAGAAIAALPMAIAVSRRRWPSLSSPARAWLAVCAVSYVILPWAFYGPVSAATKVVRAHAYTTSATRLYNPILAHSNSAAALAAIHASCEHRDAVWYIPDPLTSIEFSGPLIISDADFEPLADLAARHYDGRVPVCALLPAKFEGNGKGAAIRASFTGVARWTRRPVPSAEYDVWTADPR